MRKTKLFLMLTALAAMSWSCKDAARDLTNAIPQTAVMVLHSDGKSLLQKADYKPMDNPLFKKWIEEMKRQGSAKQTKWLESFLKNPNSATGIDVLGDCFMYMDGRQTIGLLWKMNDAKKFRQVLLEEAEMPEEMLQEENGITFLHMDRVAIVGWTKDKLLCLANPYHQYGNQIDLTGMLKAQLTQNADSSMNANKSFAKFIGDKKDISIFYAYDNLAKMYGNLLMSDMVNIGYDDEQFAQVINDIFTKAMEQFKGLNMGAFLSFEKGSMDANGKYYFASQDDQKRLTALFNQTTGELKTEQLQYFAEKPLFMMSVAMKGAGMYNYINDMGVIKMIDDKWKPQLDTMGIDLQALISNVEGDVTFALNSITTDGTYPELTVFAELKDPQSTLKLIMEKIGENPQLVKIDDNTYSFSKDWLQVFWGIKGNTLYATSSKVIFDNITSGKIANNGFAAMGKGKGSFIFGNLTPLRNLPVMAHLNEEQKALVNKGFDLFGDYFFTVNKDFSGSGKWLITDKSRNSLAVIVSYFDSVLTYAAQNF